MDNMWLSGIRISASSTFRELKTTFGEVAVSEKTARNQFKKFRSNNEILEDET